jgi:kynurenine formamidase
MLSENLVRGNARRKEGARMRVLIWIAAVVAFTGFAKAEESWFPSKYGADDTLGAINELSPEGVLEAVKLVKTGKTYALGVETGRKTPVYGTRSFELFAVASGDGTGSSFGANRSTFNDDWMLTWLGIGTQIDGLGHLGIDHVYYNGNRVEDFWHPTGLTKFATHELPPIVTRGVLLDLAGLRGVERLDGGTPIHRADLQAAEKRQGLRVRRGDVVILNTGWQSLAEVDPTKFLSEEPGLDVDGAEYLASLGVVAVGADTVGLEVLPNPNPELIFPVHQLLLAKNGIYILENIRTEELVADGVSEFLFVLGQPRFVGAVQMVINPVAIR